NKWRPYLDEELLTLLFLQLVGLRWGMRLRELFDDHLNTADGVFPQPEEEGWRREIARARLYRFGEFFLPMVPSSASELAAGEGYGGGYGKGGRSIERPNTSETLLAALNAEIRFRQAASPGQALFVLQTDLRDFYLSIPHPVLTL